MKTAWKSKCELEPNVTFFSFIQGEKTVTKNIIWLLIYNWKSNMEMLHFIFRKGQFENVAYKQESENMALYNPIQVKHALFNS